MSGKHLINDGSELMSTSVGSEMTARFHGESEKTHKCVHSLPVAAYF